MAMRDVDYSTATAFLESFFRGCEGNTEIRPLHNDGGAGRSLFGGELIDVEHHCKIWDRPGCGVFFACCTRIRGRSSGTRADIHELVAVWVDIDIYKLGLTRDTVLSLLRSCPLRPTVIVSSGGGIHAYWLLREPLDARLPADGADRPDAVKARIDAILKQLSGVFAGDPVPAQIAAVMRLPGTHNTKTGEMREVEVIDAEGPRWEIEDIEEILDWLGPVICGVGTPPPRNGHSGEPLNPFIENARRYAFKTPIDCQKRLDEMTYQGDGERGVHATQLSVSASLVRQGLDDDEIVTAILAATQRAAFPFGERWNWVREESNLRRMIADWRTKLAAEGKTPVPRRVAAEGSAEVVQLRATAGGRKSTTGTPPGAEEVVDPPPQLDGFPLNDLGNAHRMLMQHGDALIYAAGIGWHTYDGSRYKRDTDDLAVRRLAFETCRLQLMQAFDAEGTAAFKKAVLKWSIGMGNAGRISAMVGHAEPLAEIEPDRLDGDPLLLNCPNGTVNLRDGLLRPHARRDLITKITGYAYEPDAACPTWERFLLEVFDGDATLVAFVQRALGYSMTGLTSEQVIFILHGAGSNGKSVFIETVSAVLNDYVKNCPASTWTSNNASGGGPTNDVAALVGARFVPVIETEHDRHLAEALVKQATGGDKMTARFLHKEFFSFFPQFKLWFATNHRPRIRGTDYAIWRRILLLPFLVTFVDKEKAVAGQRIKDRDLKNKLLAEGPGILAWMVRGCLDWQRIGLAQPDVVDDATSAYQASQDNISAFIRDCCHLSRGLTCPVGLLYAGYELWCAENDEEAVSKKMFGTNLDERGYPPGARTKRSRLRKGIDLQEEYRRAAQEKVDGG